MYDITSEESFAQVKKIKSEIEKELNKKDAPMACVAMKTDLEGQVSLSHFTQLLDFIKRAVDKRVAMSWADREKIEHYEVSVMDRGCLADPISELINSSNFQSQNYSKAFSVANWPSHRSVRASSRATRTTRADCVLLLLGLLITRVFSSSPFISLSVQLTWKQILQLNIYIYLDLSAIII